MKKEKMSAAGYEYLLTYKLTTAIYDLTVQFCERWVTKRSRTHDQMVQAARSGRQNIPEGYKQESLKGYIKLTGVARSSQEELLKDFEDYARQNNIAVWPKEKARPYRPDRPFTLPKDRERAVNLMLTLINQTNYMLDKQIKSLEEKFIEEGGFTENLFHKRLRRRKENRREEAGNQRKSAINQRKSVLALLLAFMLGTLVGWDSARAAELPRSGIQVSPLSLEREIWPGEEFFFAVKFFNPLDHPQNVRPKFKDFVVDPEGGVTFLDYSSPRYTLSRWADFKKDIIELGPHEEVTLDVRIRVPENAAVGGHFGAFFGEVRLGEDESPNSPAGEEKRQALGVSSEPASGESPAFPSGYQVRQNVAAGTLIFLSVLGDDLGEDAWAAGLSDFAVEGRNFLGVFLTSQPISFRTLFRNEGIFHQNVWGGVEITDFLGKRVGAIHLREKKALPGAEISYFESWQPSLMFGRHNASLKMLYGRNGEREVERVLNFWVVDSRLLAAIGLGLAVGAFAIVRRRLSGK